jgi:hypothetical protein
MRKVVICMGVLKKKKEKGEREKEREQEKTNKLDSYHINALKKPFSIVSGRSHHYVLHVWC